MKLLFLGTNSAVPTLLRNTSAYMLIHDNGRIWLFDCGEGTQRQLLAFPQYNLSQIDMIFITHLHGDHVYGLFGLLSTISLFRGKDPSPSTVELVGPRGIRDLIEHVGRETDMRITFTLRIHELADHPEDLSHLDPPLIHPQRANCLLRSFPLPHRLRSYGFVIDHTAREGIFEVKLANSLGVPFGPLWGKLKKGESVTLPNGDIVHSAQVIGEPPKKKLVLLGDCSDGAVEFDGVGSASDWPPLIEAGQGANVLVHEATFAQPLADKARQHGHSTAQMAGIVAQQMNAKLLVLTHFSKRYTENEDKDRAPILSLQQEAQVSCPKTRVITAKDGDEVPI